MPESSLSGLRILVIEDEYMLADDLRTELGDAGASVVGPVGTLGEALDLIRSQAELDAAVVDVNLGGESGIPAVEALVARSVPIVLATGYDEGAIPENLRHLPRCEKPINMSRLATLLRGTVGI
ncbi:MULTISPECIES: response regulator [Sphingobium]|uniref:response regulator n=1 Tax=Sphingobium TaxID=165695 RepID=UPI001BEB9123|nr:MULTISPECIES: response regulator [Sphingobium]MBT2246804.1 response regulator [Sphingobium sp. BHU LFT2]WBQ18985.1 response regulator [Sphingobium yanoikuyae]